MRVYWFHALCVISDSLATLCQHWARTFSKQMAATVQAFSPRECWITRCTSRWLTFREEDDVSAAYDVTSSVVTNTENVPSEYFPPVWIGVSCLQRSRIKEGTLRIGNVAETQSRVSGCRSLQWHRSK